ncbi:hypothetical protein AMC99_02308 [Altererythrobacter epoxidivorans]|uniref:Uncharacterized protein n=1 Tax=Altererythrobacter epoxidivorans TaxID=361183 RepID=A0A0M4MVA0_9SPHN|nr:hypothetical protein AMC99_02308 [Altererythrobacter epoxidivorans]
MVAGETILAVEKHGLMGRKAWDSPLSRLYDGHVRKHPYYS